MASRIRVHYDNPFGFDEPHLWVWSDGSLVRSDVAPTERDDFGHVYDITVVRQEFHFKFKNGPGTAGPWEPASLDRSFRPLSDPTTPSSPTRSGARATRSSITSSRRGQSPSPPKRSSAACPSLQGPTSRKPV